VEMALRPMRKARMEELGEARFSSLRHCADLD
jgi:hypothetical protein